MTDNSKTKAPIFQSKDGENASNSTYQIDIIFKSFPRMQNMNSFFRDKSWLMGQVIALKDVSNKVLRILRDKENLWPNEEKNAN